MAKRRHSHDEELPFVALMDTMTNVVGVLIIVMVMIGIGIAASVQKILSELPPATVEQINELLKQITEAAPRQNPLQVEELIRKAEQDLKKHTEELKTYDLTKDKQDTKLMDLDDIKKKIDDGKKQRDAKKTEVEKLIAEMDRLKALLDTTPVYKAPASTVVRLPNPRPLPEKAVLQRFLVAGGKVYFLNDEDFIKNVSQQIEANLRSVIFKEEHLKGPDGKPQMKKDKFGRLVPVVKTTLDPKKLEELFKRLRIATRELKVDIVTNPASPAVPMRLTPIPETGGEDVAALRNPASAFQRLLRKFKTEPTSVVWFHVFKDSLDTYLAAREIADATGVAAGWDIYGNSYFQRNVPDFLVNYTPPKPPPNPPAVPAVVIAPPKTTLD